MDNINWQKIEKLFQSNIEEDVLISLHILKSETYEIIKSNLKNQNTNSDSITINTKFRIGNMSHYYELNKNLFVFVGCAGLVFREKQHLLPGYKIIEL